MILRLLGYHIMLIVIPINVVSFAANLDDIMQVLDALDSSYLIPAIHCEAFELLKLPPLSLDPVAEQVQSNSQALQVLIYSGQSRKEAFVIHTLLYCCYSLHSNWCWCGS